MIKAARTVNQVACNASYDVQSNRCLWDGLFCCGHWFFVSGHLKFLSFHCHPWHRISWKRWRDGQTGWMGKCKNAIGSLWKGLKHTGSGSLLQVEYSPLRLVRNLKKTKSFYTLKVPQKAENDRSTPKSISTKGKKFKRGEDLLENFWEM